MARRNQNLAGLAALGALGYALSRGRGAPVEDRVGEDVVRAVEPTVAADLTDLSDQDGGGITALRGGRGAGVAPTASVSPAPAMMSREEEARIRATGGPRGTRYLPTPEPRPDGGRRGVLYSPTDTGDETARLARRYPGTAVDRIPTDQGKYAPVSGQRVTGNEVTRNLSNMMNATAGLSVPGYVGKLTQAQYNARTAARRAAGDMTEAEIEAARRRIADSALTGGMKKGGKVKAKAKPVKKMASGGATRSSASKRADGIATKGKTRGKLY